MLEHEALLISKLPALLEGAMPEAEALAFLSELTVDKLTQPVFFAAIKALEQLALPMAQSPFDIWDTCGTGGSGLSNFNTSTTAAFLLAALGLPVVKFGNRGFSSASGSFDFLSSLKIALPKEPSDYVKPLSQTGLAFLYAPQVYPSLATLSAVRKKLKTPTVFNFTGPLLNPVQPAYRLLGCSHSKILEWMVDWLVEQQKTNAAWVFRAETGLDDLLPQGKTQVYSVKKERRLEKITLQLSLTQANQVLTGDAKTNAALAMDILEGHDRQSPCYWQVCLNGAAALLLAKRVETLEEGLIHSQKALAAGEPLKILWATQKNYPL